MSHQNPLMCVYQRILINASVSVVCTSFIFVAVEQPFDYTVHNKDMYIISFALCSRLRRTEVIKEDLWLCQVLEESKVVLVI